MLVLSRRINETLHIGADITIMVVELRAGVVRLGVEAPTELRISRDAVQTDHDLIHKQKRAGRSLALQQAMESIRDLALDPSEKTLGQIAEIASAALRSTTNTATAPAPATVEECNKLVDRIQETVADLVKVSGSLALEIGYQQYQQERAVV